VRALSIEPREVIADVATMRAVIGEPNDVVPTKIAPALNRHTRRFVELSPLHLLATSRADGSCDVTPRGDPPGSVRILDETIDAETYDAERAERYARREGFY
jgi:hypothetical protein